MGIVADPQLCDGCRICQLACSFHHQRFFAPEYSSLKVSSDYREGKIQLSIDATCDLCPEEPEPMCVHYCFTGALKKGRENEST
jgi:carbon-monoxide dehydrogenase iron sulfur subunit